MNEINWKCEMDFISKSFSEPVEVFCNNKKTDEKAVRVLIVSPYMMYPFTSGGVLRMLSPLTQMSDENLSIDFLFSTVARKNGELCKSHIEEIKVVKNVYFSISDNNKIVNEYLPNDVVDMMSLPLLKDLIHLIANNKYDIIQVEHSQLSWIVPYIRSADSDCKLILSEHNIEYRIYEKWLEYDDSVSVRKRFEELKKWEMKVWPWYDTIMTVSDVERRIIKDVYPDLKVVDFPTGGGIDMEKYQYKSEPKDYDIIYIGSQDWIPNVHGLIWFINDVFPIIEKTRPGTKLHIMGNGVSRNELINASNYSKNISFLGFQEDDVGFFHRSKVLVVPLFIGAGARVKIPTAMASSVPIVSTTFGAEGSGAVDGENILLADDPVDFAGCVLRLLDDSSFSDMIVKNAKKFVAGYYSVQRAAVLQKELYLDISGKC